MPNFIKQTGRIFMSMRSILHKVFQRATRGTSSAFKTVGKTVATMIAALVVITIVGVVVLVSIPYGMTKDEPQAKENKPSPAQVVEEAVHEA